MNLISDGGAQSVITNHWECSWWTKWAERIYSTQQRSLLPVPEKRMNPLRHSRNRNQKSTWPRWMGPSERICLTCQFLIQTTCPTFWITRVVSPCGRETCFRIGLFVCVVGRKGLDGCKCIHNIWMHVRQCQPHLHITQRAENSCSQNSFSVADCSYFMVLHNF